MARQTSGLAYSSLCYTAVFFFLSIFLCFLLHVVHACLFVCLCLLFYCCVLVYFVLLQFCVPCSLTVCIIFSLALFACKLFVFFFFLQHTNKTNKNQNQESNHVYLHTLWEGPFSFTETNMFGAFVRIRHATNCLHTHTQMVSQKPRQVPINGTYSNPVAVSQSQIPFVPPW